MKNEGLPPALTLEDIISFIAAHKAKFEQEFGVKRIGLAAMPEEKCGKKAT